MAQEIKVLVLDALDGKPQVKVIVQYSCEGQSWSPANEVSTGDDGKAEVPFKCGKEGRIGFSVFAPDWEHSEYAKSECGGLGAKTLEEILLTGFISDPSGAGNIWCPRKISRTLKPVPGQVTIFMKKPTWWQVHVAG
jgi:5-hydroxyisourate hydrolase-like protein (transthyretin family)